MQCLLVAQLAGVRVRVNLKRIIDENAVLKQEIVANSQHEVHFTIQLYSHGRPLGTQQCSNFFVPKHLFDEPIIFQTLYQDLSLDAKLAIAVWSSGKKYNPQRPLGATVIQLFDEKGQLRQGKYHLFIWPNVAPDIEDPSSTPGIANDQNIDLLNFISEKLEECDQSSDPFSARAEQTLKFRLSYIYRLIPAAFLEIEFPKFERPVFFSDKLTPEYQQTPFPQGASSSEIAQCLDIFDPQQQAQAGNPFQEMYYTLKGEKENASQKLVPSREDIRNLERIAAKGFRIQVRAAEREVLFAFRHFLVQDRKYLCHFLTSLPQQYSDQAEFQRLLAKWQRVDQADALYLLSRDFSLNPAYNRKRHALPLVKLVRDYAVSILAELKDQQLTYLLLFLVQALRYQGEGLQSALLTLLTQRAANSPQIASLVYWYLRTESQAALSKDAKAKQAEKNIRLYQGFFGAFQAALQRDSPQAFAMVGKQIRLFEVLRGIAKAVKEVKDKKAELRKRLAEVDWAGLGSVCYPIDVSVALIAPVIQQCTVFSSAMAPMKLTFLAAGDRRFSFLFKSGDDLRQDQMVLEMFDLMDRLLKGVNQDYKLTPYKALACSKSDGFVEFVPQTRTFQETKLKEYLQKLVQERSPEVMQNYVFSCAGYCAITYFFGIGDRHLQNLLISASGKMLHIDFGFILGRDPKPYPPPIKIRKDMIQAMGGIDHANFKVFKAKCLQAFLYLRKHGKIVYNLVHLMLDSGLKDVHPEGIAKLYDKFAVGMNDTQAEKHFLMVLEECKNAIAAIIADGIHRWASHLK